MDEEVDKAMLIMFSGIAMHALITMKDGPVSREELSKTSVEIAEKLVNEIEELYNTES